MNAPLVPLKRRIVFLVVLPTYRLPSDPNVNPDGASSPPLPAGTNASMNAPVMPLKRRMR